MALNNRGRGGKHVTRKSRTEAHPYYQPSSKDDLHCVYCGYIIRDGRNRKLATNTVESTYRLHRGMDTKVGGGDYCYCESCGHANREAIEKHHRFRMADLQRANIQNKVIADDLKKTNEAQIEKIKKLEELLAQKEEVHFREVYKADKDSESNCVDVKSSQEAASDTRSDPMEGEVPQQILDEILDLENSASEKEEVVMDVDLVLKDD
ncbi:unnamed protein product [Orchesella dallaii]|uniref:Uncharacterized protein n=1 Tax=Orchesella dallaii TaxID=48710 RepID=A0ABP1QBR7_9HEXA